MSDHVIWDALWRGSAASSLLSAAAFGAADRLTLALATTGSWHHDFFRHVVFGALVAGGFGTAFGGAAI